MRYALAAILLLSSPCLADVRLPKVISSGMVLQRNANVTIHGWADVGEQVIVSGDWFDEPVSATTDSNGTWRASLRTMEAGGPHSLTVAGTNTITLDDILFGEVWIGSGQSNMEMPLRAVSGAYTGILNADTEIAEADHPGIRLFQAGNFSSKEPLEDVEPGIEMYGVPAAACEWRACTPRTIPTFASTAYFFARELHETLNVPVGIIDAAWGGTPAEAWTPDAGLERLKYTNELKQAAEVPQQPDQKIPTRLYNGMIHPLRHLTIRGVIWYQGEGNAGRAAKYRDLFTTMITEWRRAFNADLPFYFLQISPYGYRGVNAAYLREAQLETLALDRTGMAVTMDIGHLTDIHPKNKQEVGRRLALWALANDYGHDIVPSGPLYKDAVVENGAMRIRFRFADSGLATRDGAAPDHFEIAGADKVFHPATASIEGRELVVASSLVSSPVAVRYAFTSEAQPNLMNREGLPASSFRTDRW